MIGHSPVNGKPRPDIYAVILPMPQLPLTMTIMTTAIRWYERDVLSQRISSPDYVDLEISQFVGVASRQQSLMSTSSEGYPSWVSKPPPPSSSSSTLPSLSTAMMFGTDCAAGPTEHPGGPARAWACLSRDVASLRHV